MGAAERAVEFYRYLNEELSDPRTRDYFLIGTPCSVLIIITSYLVFTIYLGPKLMKNLPPFEIQKIITVYNILQILVNSVMFVTTVKACFFDLKYSFICQPVGTGTSPNELYVVKMSYVYFWIKIFDLLDTVFIVLRKKSSQLSILHLYHHSAMILASWVGVKFVPGGQVALTGIINCLVHSVMYSYYLLTTLNSKYRSSWWKKHITQLQLGQFAVIAFHHMISVFDSDCEFPKLLSLMLFPGEFLLVYMFVNYYRKEYHKRKKKN